MYDVIVVGARVAGAATSMLLARSGLRVLVVDRASFPSDTLSTHQVQLPGIARLERWGLLDAVVAAGTPATRRLQFDAGSIGLDGAYPAVDGIDALYSPRRTVLDAIVVDAARAAGAEVQEGFTVDGLTFDDGVVTGIRGRSAGGEAVTESARMVVGADGKHSLVAREVQAGTTREEATRSFMYYTYWDDVPTDRGEMHARPGLAAGAWPTNDGLLLTVVAGPVAGFAAFRSDIEGNVLRGLDAVGDLGARCRAGRRVDRIYGTADTPNRILSAHGPGWALVGDAGFVMDPITGQGIGHALRDAELASDAIMSGLGGARPLDAALADYERARDRERTPMLDFTLDVATYAPIVVEQRVLMEAIRDKPAEVSRFIGVLTGAVPVDEYFAPANLRRVIGLRGFARIVAGRVRAGRARSTQAA